jgi:hypothetical protein
VVAIADDLSLAAQDAIDRQRQSDGEPVHAASGTPRLVPLDDEVPVVVLDRVRERELCSCELFAGARDPPRVPI